MDDIGTVERVFRVDRKVLLLQVLGFAAVLLVGRWILPERYREVYPVSVAIVIMFVLYALWPIVQAAITGTGAIIITDRGLLNRTGGVTFVAWDEITDARITSQMWQKRIELEVQNVDTVLQRVSPFRRSFLRRFITKYGGKPSVYVTCTEASAEEVLNLINTKRHVASHAV